MPQLGRLQRCRCGSGKRTKRCCGTSTCPVPAELAKAELAALGNSLAPSLSRFADPELHQLLDQVPELVDLDPSMAWCLPRLLPEEIETLRVAIDDVDLEAVKEALPAAVSALDDPIGRARLAHAVLGLRDTRRIGPDLAAAGVVDLASGSPQLVTASIVEAVRVDVGATARTAGLLLSR